MRAEDLKDRTKSFALRVVKLATSLPRNRVGEVLARQMIRSATSVAANYRAACLARSRPEFVSKIGIVQEEADETMFWIELTADAGLIKPKLLESLLRENKELLAIIIASRKTAKGKQEPPARSQRSPTQT